MAPSLSVRIYPAGAYLRTSNDNPALPAIVNLEDFGATPGDTLRMTYQLDSGSFSYLCGNPKYTTNNGDDIAVIGVFSRSNSLLATSELNRIPDAIDAGSDCVTGPTWFAGQPTDIPQDFRIFPSAGFEIVVPPDAKYLFICIADSYYGDNCGPVSVTLELLKPLTANAGSDQTVDEGNVVTLDGSGSRSIGDIITTYQWEQISGSPSVTLSNPYTAISTFEAPDVSSDNQFVFELAVADSAGRRATDSTTVTVKATGDFSISCGNLSGLTPNATATIPCTVHSTNGFNMPVRLNCNPSRNSRLTCRFDPAFVTPPANGEAIATLRIRANNSPIGKFTIKVSGSSTGLTTKTIDVNVRMICLGLPAATQYNQLPDGIWELRASTLQQAAEIIQARPNHEGALIEWFPTYNITGHDTEGNVACVEVRVCIRQTWPNWQKKDEVLRSQADKVEWDRYIIALKIHEQGHVGIVHRGYKDFSPKDGFDNAIREMKGATDNGAKEIWEEIVAQTKKSSDKYDGPPPDGTDHGRTQGAKLYPSGWDARRSDCRG